MPASSGYQPDSALLQDGIGKMRKGEVDAAHVPGGGHVQGCLAPPQLDHTREDSWVVVAHSQRPDRHDLQAWLASA